MIVAGLTLPDGDGEDLLLSGKKLSKCLLRAKELASSLRKAAGCPKATKTAVRRCLRSRAWLTASRFRANWKRPLCSRETAAQILAGANLKFWDEVPEELVQVSVRPKSSGGFRTICRFGLDYSMMLEAARGLLEPTFRPKPWQCDYRNSPDHGGVFGAISKIQSCIVGGNLFAARLDVVDFYPSFDMESCVKANPPYKKVMTHYLTGRHMPMVVRSSYGISPHIILRKARRGGVVGSTFSSLMGGLIMSQLEWEGPTVLFNYVDDFLILGSTMEEVEKAVAALEARVSALPGGHFQLKVHEANHLSNGVQFLGHQMLMSETGVKTQCTYKAVNSMYGKVRVYDAKAVALSKIEHGNTANITRLLGDAWVYAKSWGEAFKLCEDAKGHLEVVQVGLENTCNFAGISWSDVDAHRNPSSHYRYGSGE